MSSSFPVLEAGDAAGRTAAALKSGAGLGSVFAAGNRVN
jgi:hypothetical protein